ncbi:MAG: xylan 1,4-beta-xylosidase [Nocardioidaceae bacterium]
MSEPTAAARTDWEDRIGRRSDTAEMEATPRLPPPESIRARCGRGQVTLDWSAVPGAVGYQIYVADGDEEARPLDHAGRDVLAVPHPPYVDTTTPAGPRRRYSISTLSDVVVEGQRSDEVVVEVGPDGQLAGDGAVRLVVDVGGDTGPLERPWRPMIGSEHLSHALSTERTGGREIGPGLSAALRAAHEELGVESVRAHGIFCDDVGVYREIEGEPVHDFTVADRVYDHVLSLGLRPVVELSFMPRDLASDPSKTVFEYQAIVSPPKDWGRWADLVTAFVQHLVDRYGLEEVRDRWSFEVWNEANLEVFWSGTKEEYWRLYDVTVAAVLAVDASLTVGGPSSAAAGWVDELLTHADRSESRVDFVSTHTYGSPPLDFRPTLERHGRSSTPLWWTEWGVTPTHFNEVSDAVFAGVFLLSGMASSMGRIEALSYWVVSDHFEELGRPASLTHGGFGLLTVGELRKPRWWALALLERLGPRRVPVRAFGDGAGSLVDVLATRDDATGRHAVLVWNFTLDQTKASGDPQLDRDVTLAWSGLEPGTSYTLEHHRVDADHSNVPGAWKKLRRGDQVWPDEDQWRQLEDADRLDVYAEPREVTADDNGSVSVSFPLPMPGMSFVELARA